MQMAFAQTTDQAAPTAADRPQQKKSFIPEMDVSVGTYGQFTATRAPVFTTVYPLTGTATTQVTQSASPSVGVFGTLHQSFTRWLGYNVNFGYTRFSENYSNGQAFIPNSTSTLPSTSSFIRGSVKTNMMDLTVAGVVEGPRTRRFSTFAQFGGGGLFFEPIDSKIGATQQTRPAMVFGTGANFKLTDRLALRAEYRGLFYKSPDFNVTDITPGITPTNQFPMTRLFTMTSTPAVSLVYRFGGAKIHQSSAKSH
jgi:opacity protein-like surface antigen